MVFFIVFLGRRLPKGVVPTRGQGTRNAHMHQEERWLPIIFSWITYVREPESPTNTRKKVRWLPIIFHRYCIEPEPLLKIQNAHATVKNWTVKQTPLSRTLGPPTHLLSLAGRHAELPEQCEEQEKVTESLAKWWLFRCILSYPVL